mgnify:CR=1 FL=1
MVEWLAGNRIRGTNAERKSTDFGLVGGWKELARTTLGSTTATIDVSSIPDKRYYMTLLSSVALSQGATSRFRYNGITSTTKAYTQSSDGGGDVSDPTVNGINIKSGSSTELPWFNVGYHTNLSGKEKIMMSNTVQQNASGEANAPSRDEIVGKQDLSSSINQITSFLASTGNYSSGCEMVVLGYDPDDIHTDNFWEELGTVSGNGSTDILDVNIAAKKYLWVQYYLDVSATYTPEMRFNGSTASEYNNRYSLYGSSVSNGTDGAATGYYPSMGGDKPQFNNMFIINIDSKEKLMYNWCAYQGDAGADNTLSRVQSVGKWDNTAQITSIKMESNGSSSALSTNSIMKVWGHD